MQEQEKDKNPYRNTALNGYGDARTALETLSNIAEFLSDGLSEKLYTSDMTKSQYDGLEAIIEIIGCTAIHAKNLYNAEQSKQNNL